MVAGEHRGDPIGANVDVGASGDAAALLVEAGDASGRGAGLARTRASEQQEVARRSNNLALLLGQRTAISVYPLGSA